MSPETVENVSAAEPAGNQPAADPREKGAAAPIPPADFETLVQMFSMQAMVSLGAIPDPGSGKPEVQLTLARHFIDLLGVVEAKTRGNLSPDEASLLDGSLHSLRMLYLEQSRKSGS